MVDSMCVDFNINLLSSNRIICIPSTFAYSSLIHRQETRILQVTHPYKNERNGLSPYPSSLFYEDQGNLPMMVMYVDYKKLYSHESGITRGRSR